MTGPQNPNGPNGAENSIRDAILRGRNDRPAPGPGKAPVQDTPSDEPQVTQPTSASGKKRVIVEADIDTLKALQGTGARVIELGGDDGAGNVQPRARGSLSVRL